MERQAAEHLYEKGDEHAPATPPVTPERPADMSRHKRLRAATMDIHARLDGQVSAAGYFETPQRYATYIDRMLGFQRSFDRAASGICDAWLEAWAIPSRAGWLEQDLASCRPSDAPFSGRANVGASQFKLASPSQLLGGLYVSVGAGLGSRVLLARAKALELPDGRGVSYLTGLSASARWPEFLRFLQNAPGIDEHDMCTGAILTFESVATHLAEHDAP